MSTPITDNPSTDSVWVQAQKRCWAHVEVATMMMKLMSELETVRVTSVIPILSDSSPTLLLVPERPDDLMYIKALCRLVKTNLQSSAEWDHLNINSEWVFRLRSQSNITIDVMTRLPAVKEAPITL